jgi:fumarate hydratase class II
MSGTRSERDSFGVIEVPADRLWGAQTQRSLEFFAIAGDRMPMEIVHALATIKAASARVNHGVSAVGLADRLGHPEQHERQ